MQISISWEVFGPGYVSGTQFVQRYLTSVGARDVRVRTEDSVPLSLSNIRRDRDPSSGIPDDGLTATVAAPNSSRLRGDLPFVPPAALAADRSPTDAEREALRALLARVSGARIMSVTATIPGTPSLRGMSRSLNAQLSVGLQDMGGFFLGSSGVRVREVPQSSLGWWLFGFALAGAAYYANQRRGSLGEVDPPFGWTTGAHIPRFKSKAAAQAWADKAKRRSGRRWRVFSVLVAGETRYVPYTERT